MDRTKFKHRAEIRVRNYEVDWQGIVHNAVYLQYFEIGRIEYFKRIGMTIDRESILNQERIVLVRNEIDYKASATFDDVLTVVTRMSRIGNSSFVMEGIIERAGTHEEIARNIAFHAWLDPKTKKSRTVPDGFRRRVQEYEGADCAIEWPSVEV
jgi:acyl-CoA thioester hydrolase